MGVELTFMGVWGMRCIHFSRFPHVHHLRYIRGPNDRYSLEYVK